MSEENRWYEFDNLELGLIGDGLDMMPPRMVEKVLERLRSEVQNERARRRYEQQQPTYRGPGYYTHVDEGTTVKVVGEVEIAGRVYALIGQSLTDEGLWGVPMEEINERDGDRRLYEFSEVIR